MRKIVYAVGAAGSDKGWPPEVFVLFEDENEAKQHSAKAYYAFDVFPLPIFQSYDECPPLLRLTEARSYLPKKSFAVALMEVLDADAAVAARQETAPVRQLSHTVWAVGSHEEGSPEVDALYATKQDAQQHAEKAYCMLRVFRFPLYSTYDACPVDKRFTELRPALSQRVRAKLR